MGNQKEQFSKKSNFPSSLVSNLKTFALSFVSNLHLSFKTQPNSSPRSNHHPVLSQSPIPSTFTSQTLLHSSPIISTSRPSSSLANSLRRAPSNLLPFGGQGYPTYMSTSLPHVTSKPFQVRAHTQMNVGLRKGGK